jgi:predicted ATPase with chaperone activity
MTLAEAIDTTRIHRVAGVTGRHTTVITTRPCRAPHHTIADVGLIGGGHIPMPGTASLGDYGLLCVNTRLACRRHEGLRLPPDHLPGLLVLIALASPGQI